jgi:hypothetical protein
MVNEPQDVSSESSRASEDSGDLQKGDLYVFCFGDNIYVRQENILRIGFQNAGGFPTQKGKVKEDNIRQGILKWDFDIFGTVETNLDWRLLQEQEKLPMRTKEWCEQQHISWCHNRNASPRQVRQYGGCALFSVNKAVHRAIEKGCDRTNLGRWAWTRYKGKGEQTLRVITAYRPNPPQGPFSVYAQHNAYFHSIDRQICPRQAFLMDLILELENFLLKGDKIILMLDGNSNMKNSDLSRALCKLSLYEAILSKHGLDGPATHKRNATKSPVDGIWMSPGLEILKGGYFEYDEVIPSDHRCLWIDLTFISAFGHNMPPISKRQPRRLHCKDPRLVQNYIKLFHQYAGPLKLAQQVRELEKKAPFMTKTELISEYESLDKIRCETVAFAERHCRKLRRGQVAFSPELNDSRLRIKAWILLIKSKKYKVSSRLIKRTLRNANITIEHRGWHEDELNLALKEEYQTYYKIKSNASQLRLTALEQLAMALAEQGNTD